jgi:hypothetical protein
MKSSKINLGRILKEVDDLVDQIPIKGKPHDVLLYSYMLSLFDICNDINFLYSKDRFRNIPVLVRSFIETYIDMKLISVDIKFIDPLILKADKEEKKKLNGLLKGGNISKRDIEILSKALSQVDKAIEDRSVSISKDYKIQSISDKFKKLGMSWFYETQYNELCAFSHNEIRKIEERHIKYNGDSVVILDHLNRNQPEEINRIISITESFLVDALTSINNKTGLDCTDQLKRIEEMK